MIDSQRPTWSNAKHAAQLSSTLTTYAFSKIGSKLVTDITSADILAVLTPIWTEKPETASRVRQRMETVLDWTVAQGYRIENPATRSITKVLPMGGALFKQRRVLMLAGAQFATDGPEQVGFPGI